jgi:phosphate transport system substrate-binding protein
MPGFPGLPVPPWVIAAGVLILLIIVSMIVGAVVRSSRAGGRPAARLSGAQWFGVIVVAALVSAGVAFAAVALMPMGPPSGPDFPMPPEPWGEYDRGMPSTPEGLPHGEKALPSPSGSLAGVGSDTVLQLVTAWIGNLRAIYPDLQITYIGKGSSTAPPALIDGRSEFGPMVREMKPSELEAFVDARGYEPTRLTVALDAAVVYVNSDNPIKALSSRELQGLFGTDGEWFTTWGEVFRSVGQEVPAGWEDRAVSLFGRNSASGTNAFFKRYALNGMDFRDGVKEMPGSPAVINGVESDPGAVGYTGAGWATSRTREVPVGKSIDSAVMPTAENALSGDYPFARSLYVYIDKGPDGISANLRAFLEYAFSGDGQAEATKLGFFALPEDVRLDQLARLD